MNLPNHNFRGHEIISAYRISLSKKINKKTFQPENVAIVEFLTLLFVFYKVRLNLSQLVSSHFPMTEAKK